MPYGLQHNMHKDTDLDSATINQREVAQIIQAFHFGTSRK